MAGPFRPIHRPDVAPEPVGLTTGTRNALQRLVTSPRLSKQEQKFAFGLVLASRRADTLTFREAEVLDYLTGKDRG